MGQKCGYNLGGNRMKFDLEQIISEENLMEFEQVEEKIKALGTVLLFKNNRPAYAILPIEEYEKMIEKQEGMEEEEENLEVLLNKVGKKVFVDYYEIFKEDCEPEQKLRKEGFTLTSRRSRSSSARTIFKKNLQEEALKSILVSKRLDMETIKKATKLLEEESGDTVMEQASAPMDKMKLGRRARGIITLLLKEERFTKEELALLQTLEFSKETFGLNFPLLKEIKVGEDVKLCKKDLKGYNRYYDFEVVSGDKMYLICSQWVEKSHKNLFNVWVQKKLLSIALEKIDKMERGKKISLPEILGEYGDYIGDIEEELVEKLEEEVRRRDGKREIE